MTDLLVESLLLGLLIVAVLISPATAVLAECQCEYRTVFQVKNDGPTPVAPMTGVMLMVDTAGMGARLRPDCSDLYFTLDPFGNGPLLLHWFESSCRVQSTTAAHVWVDLELPGGDSAYVYAFHGAPSASSGGGPCTEAHTIRDLWISGAAPQPGFILNDMDENGDCWSSNTPWSVATEFSDKYLMIANTWSNPIHVEQHAHQVGGAQSLIDMGVRIKEQSWTANFSEYVHVHWVPPEPSSLNTSHPPYKQTRFCGSRYLDLDMTSKVMFAVSGNVPHWADATWTQPWNDPPKYLRGCGGSCRSFDSSDVGSHSHARDSDSRGLSMPASGAPRTVYLSGPDENFAPQNHRHQFGYSFTDAQNEPPYIDVTFAMVTDGVELKQYLSDTSLIIFSSAVPPLGWEIHPIFAVGEAKLLRGTAAATTGNSGGSWMHGHDYTIQFYAGGVATNNGLGDGGQPKEMSRGDHMHSSISLTTISMTHYLPHQPAIPLRRRSQSQLDIRQIAASVKLADLVCWTVPYIDGTVCNGAPCLANDLCGCDDGYVGDCEYPECWKKSLWSHSEADVCGVGNCTAPEVCSCGEPVDCYGIDLECHGLLWSDEAVCSGRGNCSGEDVCACDDPDSYHGGEGHDCSIPKCFDELAGSPGVCSGHGICTAPDTCVCDGGFDYWEDCSVGIISCGGVVWSAAPVCSGHGTCVSYNNCSCDWNWTSVSAVCDITCGGLDSTDLDVCSKHGKCLDFDTCDCDATWIGSVCSQQDGDIMVASGLSAGEIVGIAIGATAAVLLVLLLVVFLVVIVCIVKKRNGKDIVVDDGPKDALEELEKREARMSVAKLEIDQRYADIQVKKTIGSGGSSAIVFQAEWQGTEAAFKAFKLHDFLDSKERFAEFEREVRMMASVHHPNVLSFFGACLHPPRVGILMGLLLFSPLSADLCYVSEYCSNGDLTEYLKEKADTAIDVRIRFLKEIAAALQYLHSKDIIHRDLKPENCLLNESLHIKVMDFGLSRTGKGSATKTTMVGTQSYMAPEIILSSGHYDSKIDVFSFGVVIFTLLTGRFEPYGADVMLVEMKVANDATFRPQFEEGEEEKFPAPLMDLMRKCWGAEPEGRPDFKSIVDTLKEVE